jgi:hypothetical protein
MTSTKCPIVLKLKVLWSKNKTVSKSPQHY